MHFRCPGCQAKLKARPEQARRRFRCPKCRAVVTVPVEEDTGSGVSQALSAAETGAAGAASTPGPAAAAGAAGVVPWEPGVLLLDDYQVERLLGSGGMGDVYLVRSRSTGEPFAVKRVLPELVEKQRHRQAFLAELRAWIDLPGHPNLTACRFFRTVEDEVIIFAEYVQGGSLEEWIGGPRLSSLEQVLDVAIQFAWGLEAAHRQGLIHQDVKPANVLITPEGTPKVTDFGLAKVRAAIEGVQAGEVPVSSPGDADDTAARAAQVTGALGTPAYQSPEQAARERLSEKTDIWSWGLSVLAMFAGERTWSSGVAADRVLELRMKAAAEGDVGAFRVGPPASVVDVLRRCFQRDPAERWSSMDDVAEVLIEAYREETGRPYPRQRPFVLSAAATPHDRRTSTGVTWDDPREWLTKALEAAGSDPAEADRLIRRRAGSRQAQAIDDLIVYEEALRIYSGLVASGRKDLEDDLATLCIDKAFVHGSAGDMPGEIGMYDRAIQIRQRLVHQEGRRELADDLAWTYRNKAAALYALGDNRETVALYDKAIEIQERLVHHEGQRELANHLARTYTNKAAAVGALGDERAAVALYDKAMEIQERLVHQEGRRELADDLAWTYTNKAASLNYLGDNRAAVALYDKAIEICERLVHQEGRPKLADDLAWTYRNKAAALYALGDDREAVALYDKAIEIQERLVHQEGRRELADDLARTYRGKAATVGALGDERAAVALYDKAMEIQERLVHQEGRRELADGLARTYTNKAASLNYLGDNRAAVALYDKVIEIYDRLVHQEGRRELADGLARTYMNKANAVADLGHNRAAVALYDKAIEIYDRLVHQEGRRELADRLAMTYMNKANTVDDVGDNRAAVALYDKAIELYEHLVHQKGRRELAGDLSRVQLYWANAARKIGRQDEAARVAREAIQTLESEVGRTGQADLQGVLNWARKNLADLL